jgi:hypothetical protein
MRNPSLIRAVIAGLLGGLAGDIAMQLLGAGIFALLGWPLDTSFRIIGDAVVAFFPVFDVQLVGATLVGVLTNVLIGGGLGAILGVLVVRWKRLAMSSLKKGILISIVYVEVMSVPLLTVGSLSLGMTARSTATWCGISFVLHLVYGVVLGAVMRVRLKSRAEVVTV